MELGESALPKLFEDIRNKTEELLVAGDRNAIFWNMYGRNFHGYVNYQVSGALNSYRDHAEFLIDWMQKRWNWMTDNILQAGRIIPY